MTPAAAYAFASARYRADRIVVWGFSLGSGVAVALAADQPVGKLILEAPYTSIADVAAAASVCAGALADAGQFHSDRRIARVTAPLLIMHGARDPAIPIRLWRAIVRACPGAQQFVRFAEGGPRQSDHMVRSKRPGGSSILQEADVGRALTNGPFPEFEDEDT